jgi:WD40 repeat protein
VVSLKYIGNYTLASGMHNGDIVLWNLYSSKLTMTLPGHTGEVRWLKLLKDIKKLISYSFEDGIYFWDLDTLGYTQPNFGTTKIYTIECIGQAWVIMKFNLINYHYSEIF